MRDSVIGVLCVGGASRRLTNKQAGRVIEFSQAASSFGFCCFCVYLFILFVNCAALNTLIEFILNATGCVFFVVYL